MLVAQLLEQIEKSCRKELRKAPPEAVAARPIIPKLTPKEIRDIVQLPGSARIEKIVGNLMQSSLHFPDYDHTVRWT